MAHAFILQCFPHLLKQQRGITNQSARCRVRDRTALGVTPLIPHLLRTYLPRRLSRWVVASPPRGRGRGRGRGTGAEQPTAVNERGKQEEVPRIPLLAANSLQPRACASAAVYMIRGSACSCQIRHIELGVHCCTRPKLNAQRGL